MVRSDFMDCLIPEGTWTEEEGSAIKKLALDVATIMDEVLVDNIIGVSLFVDYRVDWVSISFTTKRNGRPSYIFPNRCIWADVILKDTLVDAIQSGNFNRIEVTPAGLRVHLPEYSGGRLRIL